MSKINPYLFKNKQKFPFNLPIPVKLSFLFYEIANPVLGLTTPCVTVCSQCHQKNDTKSDLIKSL